MATAAEVKKSVGEWVKWAVVLSYALMGGIITHLVSNEHRVTTVEQKQESAERSAVDTKKDVYRRLDRQDDNQAKMLTIMSDVQASVATIKGYLEGTKTAKQQ